METITNFLKNYHCTEKPVLSGHLKRRPKIVFKTDYHLMQVKSIAECSKHSAILLTFINLPFGIKIFVLSIFEWPLNRGFTVYCINVSARVIIKKFQKGPHLKGPNNVTLYTLLRLLCKRLDLRRPENVSFMPPAFLLMPHKRYTSSHSKVKYILHE